MGVYVAGEAPEMDRRVGETIKAVGYPRTDLFRAANC